MLLEKGQQCEPAVNRQLVVSLLGFLERDNYTVSADLTHRTAAQTAASDAI